MDNRTYSRISTFALSNVLRPCLIASLVLNSVPAFPETQSSSPPPLQVSDFVPTVPGLDPEAPLPKDFTEKSLPPSLLAIAKRRVKDTLSSPASFQKLLQRKVRTYFSGHSAADVKATKDARAQLLADAVKVYQAFEADDSSGEFNTFAKDSLKPFIESLRADLIENPIQQGIMTEPVAEWSLQTLVVKEMIGHLSRYKDFSKRILGLLVGNHLKGATYVAGTLVTWTILHHFFPNMTTAFSVGVANAVWLAIMTGPVATITTAGAGFFVRPTTELVQTMGSRATGTLEAKINNLYDFMVAKLASGGSPELNNSVRIATFEDQHTTFAGMTPEDQLRNWTRGMAMFIMVQNLFGRLLRSTHHAGRDLMMLSWTDSQNITQLIGVLDVSDHVLQGLEMAILAPYRNAFINNNDMARKNEFNRRVRTFDSLTEDVWLNPDADQAAVDQLAAKIEEAANALREYGLDDYEIRELLNIQRKRGQAIGKLITAAAVGHLRSFYGAERNRNLAEDARRIATAIQVGFGSEEYTERYLPLVRRQMRLMLGDDVFSSADPASPVTDPKTIQREDCLVRELRRTLKVPAGAKPETYACVNALLGFKSYKELLDKSPAVAELLSRIKSQGHQMEAAGIIRYVVTLQGDSSKVQDDVKTVLNRCQ